MLSFRPNASIKFVRVAAAALTVFATLPLASADARPSSGFSQGSRGLKTYTPPPSTRTAPTTAQPMERSATQAAQTATAARSAATSQSRFGSGFMGGLLGAGLIGALFGAGLFGGLGSLTAVLGFLLQLALIAGAVYLVVGYFRSRRQTGAQTANLGPQDELRRTGNGIGSGPPRSPAPGSQGIRIGGGAAPAATKPLSLETADFNSFERLLGVVQTSYGREDLDALRTAATAEMVGYFQEELQANARNGVRNEVGAPKLLSGDLSEAWSEPSGEYATVAMRYALTDAMVDRTSGKVVSGCRDAAEEVTEVWTFTRRIGGGPGAWRLSAVQQVE